MRRQYRIFDQPYLHFIRSIWTTNTALFIQKSITLNVSFNPFIMNIHSAIKFKKKSPSIQIQSSATFVPAGRKGKRQTCLGLQIKTFIFGVGTKLEIHSVYIYFARVCILGQKSQGPRDKSAWSCLDRT